MPKKRSFTETEKDRIVKAYEAGGTVRDIAEFNGSGEGTIGRVLKEKGVPIREPRRGQLDEDRNAAIIRKHKEGVSLREIAVEYHVSPQRVHFIISRGY